MTNPTGNRAAIAGSLALLLLGGLFMVLRLLHDPFDPDELQHAHIAWLVARGLVPYRDFWEHHGPLFGLLNGGLIHLAGLAPSAGLILACRAGGLLATLATAATSFALARRLGLPARLALAGVAALLMLSYVQDKGTECRPDELQNLFWVGGLALLLGGRAASRLLAAGALFGLAVLTNVKAGLGPFCVALWYLGGRRLHGLGLPAVARDLGLLLAGALVPYLACAAWFASHDALGPLHYYTTVWNRAVVSAEASAGRARGYVLFMLGRQLPFTLAAAAGFGVIGRRVWSAAPGPDRGQDSLFLVAALGTAAGVALNDYSQFFLMFLPLWSVAAAAGLGLGAEFAARRPSGRGPDLYAALLAAGAGILVLTAGRWIRGADHPDLVAQKEDLAWMIRHTARTEPVGAVWSGCSAFVFNDSPGYWWIAEPGLGHALARQGEADPFAESFVAELDARHVRFVAGRRDPAYEDLPAVTRRYLDEGFSYRPCLWARP